MKPNESDLTPQQQVMIDVWEKHMRAEFVEQSADAALATMSATPHLNHVPVMTGAVGREEIRAFYAERFIPQMPQDAEIELVSRTDINWDQASVLVQAGLLRDKDLPVAGAETAQKILDPKRPSNTLTRFAADRRSEGTPRQGM